jgi:GTPase
VINLEKAILLGVHTGKDSKAFEQEMLELKSLCEACDVAVVETIVQNLASIHPTTYFGRGKLQEVAEYLENNEYDTLVFNDELTPAQVRNIEEVTKATIYDRTFIILEIFRRRAKTKEAMLQVEIATLQYLLPRVDSLRSGFSRQGGGDGGFYNRGSGETQLELDRRVIRNKIAICKTALKDLTSLRQQQRLLRKRNKMKIVSLVGYTNSGKSSTLNALLQYSNGKKKEVLEKDMVFATLETSTRLLKLQNFQTLITDTVGFVQKLPHHLVEAFKSTLEEITESDLILHIVDASNPDYEKQIKTTHAVLTEIGVENIPIIYVFNKIDRIEDYFFIPSEYSDAIRISAKTQFNLDRLVEKIKERLFSNFHLVHILIPYEDVTLLHRLQETQAVDEIHYLDHGIEVKAKVSAMMLSQLTPYITKSTD